MQDSTDAIPQSARHEPWNKGKLIGAKPPLRPKHAVHRERGPISFPVPRGTNSSKTLLEGGGFEPAVPRRAAVAVLAA
jgi:hypothetical protein